MSVDLHLLTRAARGDDDAYTAWLEPLRPQLLRYAADRLGGDRAEAEDVVQDAAMRGLLALRDGRVPANPRAWMYVIVRNRCHDVRDARRPAQPLDDARAVASAAPGPEDVAASRRTLDAVVGAIGALPDSQRRALVSATLEGRPYEEIAAREATSVQAVKSLVHRARRGLAASGARAAAFMPGLFAFRGRLRGAGAGGDGLAALVSQHTAAVASVAAVAVAAVPAAGVVEHGGRDRGPQAGVVAAASGPTAGGGAGSTAKARPVPTAAHAPADSADAVAQACADGAPLDGYSFRALLAAKRHLPASDAEYGGGCSGRIAAALQGAAVRAG